MLNSETVSCILEGICIEMGCSYELLLQEVTKFFDIYEVEVHNRITQDPIYKKVLEECPNVIKHESKVVSKAVLFWLPDNKGLDYKYLNLRDNKNREFIDPFNFLGSYAGTRTEQLQGLKETYPKAYKKLMGQGYKILKIHNKRIKIFNDFRFWLGKDYLTVKFLKVESPEIFKLYETGRNAKRV